MKRFFVFTFILNFFIYFCCGFSDDLYGLKEKEKESLEFFFRSAFYDTFGYVLFGDKPMALGDFRKICIWENGKIRPIYKIAQSIADTLSPNNLKIKDGWKVLKKHIKCLVNDDFIIKSESNPWNNDDELIIIINKELFFETIKKNQNDFYNVLGKNFNPQKLWEECRQGKNLLKDLLRGHNGLIGTLLGYGRDNAWNFHERNRLLNEEIQDQETKDKIRGLTEKLTFFANEDHEKIDKLVNEMVEPYLANLPKNLRLPMFVADSESFETKSLKENYIKNREHIISLYKGKDFLRLTLERLKGGCSLDVKTK